jgi:hypothetical protein
VKARSISEIQKELKTLPAQKLIEITSRVVKFKKENKELVTYLLFESDDEEGYLIKIKSMVDEMFTDINSSNLYYVKKTFRKILRTINKFIKYSGVKQSEIELRIYFLKKIRSTGIRFHKNKVLVNLYENQIKKIESALSKVHEDLRFDFAKELEELSV